MALCLLCFVIETLHWPLVGDSSLIHYLIFLMQHGMAPYRDIVDAQMPGTYLYDWLVVHTFGGDARGLRLFDLFLMAASIAAMVAIAWPERGSKSSGFLIDNRYAAFLAGGLFALVHGRDGVPQGGQRDLIMAMLLLVCYAAVFHSLRRHSPWLIGVAACVATTAITIKPTVLPAAFVVFLVAAIQLYRTRQRLAPYLFPAMVGAALPIAAVLIFLAHQRAFAYFVDALHGMWPYYATLGKRPTGYLLHQSFSPLPAIACVGLLTLFLRTVISARAPQHSEVCQSLKFDWESVALYAGLLLSLTSVFSQGKGYPYHRYPFLAFLTLVLLLEFNHALRWAGSGAPRKLAATYRTLGVLGMALSVLFLAPVSTYKISQFDWRSDDYYQSLSRDLARASESLRGPGDPPATPQAVLSHHIQCLDAYAGCVNTLYRMGLVESTGFTVDYYFWRPKQNAVTDQMRRRFWQALQQNPPQVFVITSQWFPNEASHGDTFDKVKEWPRFSAYLDSNYRLFTEQPPFHVRWSSHSEQLNGYRIYIRKP